MGELRRVPPSKESEQSVAVEAPEALAALSSTGSELTGSELAEQPPPVVDPRQDRWERLLLPSFSDLFFLAIVL